MHKDNIFIKYPRFLTFVFSAIIIFIFFALLVFILNLKIFQDPRNQEKYSFADQIIYKIRCNDERNIKLRESKPNHIYKKLPSEKFKNLAYKEYILRTDNDGFIKPSFINQNPDLQIFFLGGSTTECEMVDEEFRFPYLVGRKLEELTQKKINSENGGKSGNNSIHSINNLVNKILPYNPDIVVMMDNINDLSSLIFEGTYWSKNKNRSNLSCIQKNTSDLTKGDEWAKSRKIENIFEADEQARIKKIYKENLKIFINISKAKNIIPVLMTQANRIEKNPEFTTKRGSAEFDKIYQKLYIDFNNITREVAREENILLIDLAKKVPAQEKYLYDVVHVNKAGSILEAEIISDELNSYLKKINYFNQK
jgi:lysophospholipase L1-like esterase